MRLQLTVQRHGIPPVQILWTVTPSRPPLAAAGSSITVSQFLEQVNDIIPLESEDWGLEDYAVEIRGFECLHFSELGQVLKDEDEVCIRPLHTTDLRIRRISGRHQISADGKHLIDGVAFGRPYLRRVDRPAVRIPPRKRRRITYNEDDEINEDEDVHDRQIVLRAGFNNADESMNSVESDEEDFSPDFENDENLDAELEDLYEDLRAGANDDEHTIAENGAQGTARTSRRKSRRSPKGLGLLRLLDEHGQPFVGEYDNPLLDKYDQAEPPPAHQLVGPSKRRSRSHAKGPVRSAKHGVQDSSASLERVSRRGSAGSNKSVHFEDAEPATPVTVRESQDSDEEDDDDFELDEVDESDKENAEPPIEEADSGDESSNTSASSSTSLSEQFDGDETSSSGSSSSDSSSDSDSDSDSEPEQLPTKDPGPKADSSGTSSSDSSSSSSDSEPELRKKAPRSERVNKNPQSQKSEGNATEVPAVVPPGQGKKRTQSRNRRRRESKSLAYLKLQGILTSKASAADLRRYKESQQSETLYANSAEKLSDGVKMDFNDAFNAKRQELLTSIATGSIDILPISDVPVDMRRENEPDSDQHEKNVATDEPETQAPKDDETSSSTYSQDKPMINGSTDTAAVVQLQDSATKNASAAVPPPTPDGNTNATPSPSSQHRRSKLDLSGAKRMLFGSLGLKPPKTKQDELKTREKLMKDVKPATEPQVEMETENLDDIAADDSWKNKIDLRAVECCHEGIELSTPPFPFVQRWDPQQQRGYRDNAYHKGKGKKRKRNNSNYYEQSSYEGSQRKLVRYDDYEAPQEESHLFDANASGVTQDEEPLDDSCDQNFRDSQAVDEQLLRETDEAAEDLPSLPEDLTTCRTLTRKATKEGLIIAFKQLEMSAETNWQPNISEYQIAAVDDVRSDGVLEMTPAKRDHPTKQVEYDGTTGKRLYSKFEMPGYDDEDDSGKLEISFDELIDPIILRDVQDESDVDKQVNNQLEGSRAEDAAAAREPGDKNFEGHEFGLDGTANIATEPSEENRKEISELIKDAGWRSSIQSAANGGLTAPEDADHQEKRNEHDDSTLIDAPSPKFNGFSSSPVVNVRSSPPIPEVHDPKQMYASGTEITESVPAQDSSSKSVASDRKSAVEYPSLPQLGDESELLQEEAQHRSDPLFERQLLSQDLISSGMDQTPAQSTRSHTNNSQEINPLMSSPSLRAAAESEDEFPELFSQAWESRMSQEVEIKPEFSQNNSISPPSYRRPKGLSKRGSLQKDSNHSWRPDNDNSVSDEEDDEDGASTPRPSQQKSSLVVDLTLSSDSVEFGQKNDDDDSYKLPNGPGWVKKARASRERSASIKANAGKMKTKSR